MRRREFITLIGGAAATWPLVARAQSQERVRRVAMLIALDADNADAQAYRAAFLQALQQLGWTDDTTCGSRPDGAEAAPPRFANKPPI
jgi:putative ABC transport system substrate-binding protein